MLPTGSCGPPPKATSAHSKEIAAAVDNEDGVWNRALMLAAMNGRLDVCRLLVEDLRVDVNPSIEGAPFCLSGLYMEGVTAVLMSAMYGTPDTTRYLLDHGADPTDGGSMGSALHGAAMTGHSENAELLLSRGMDVDIFDPVHGTALHIASARGEAGVVKVLLEHHADPNMLYNLRSKPLRMAMEKKSLECVRLLIKAGADVNFVDHIGVTYLMVAASNGLPEIMKCLLDAFANPNTADASGRTAIQIAALNGRRNIVEMLFPLTSPLSTVPVWSIDGIISHAKFYNPRVNHPLELEEKIAKLKLEATDAFRRNEFFRAAELYTCAMKLEDRGKEHAVLLANRSICFLRLGQGEEAVSDAIECTRFRPHWPKGYYRKGAACMLLKDYEKACEAFEDGLKLDNTNVDIKNALREAQEALKGLR